MTKKNFAHLKVGVLGGGQLGKMLSLPAANWDLPLYFLDQSKTFPAGIAGNIIVGSFQSYEDVLNFGRQMDVVTIEIEHVNTEALHQLKKEGIIVHPDPVAIDLIKDKGRQKQFYQEKQIPTSPFQLFDNAPSIRKAINTGLLKIPFVQKSRKAGYDGKGVMVISKESQLDQLMDTPSVVENLVDIQKELAVVVARNERGEIKAFPTVEMVFNPTANLVECLLCPAQVTDAINKQAQELAIATMEAFKVCGVLAVEMFLTPDDQLMVNEVAPRPHNSGHHTIESCYTSQFEQHLRGILNLPLGDTSIIQPAAMVNILGTPPHVGFPQYEGLESAFTTSGAYVHVYGKTMTKPFRKMGHVTVLNKDIEWAHQEALKLLNTMKVIS